MTTLKQLKWAILTAVTVLALAYAMNKSGLMISLGRWGRWHLRFHRPDGRLARRGSDGF